MSVKNLLRSPYLYIVLVSYYGIWLNWNNIYVPYINPYHIISVLPLDRYNPNSNILRFLLGILVPLFFCWIYWLISSRAWLWSKEARKQLKYNRVLAGFLVAGSIALLAAMGMIQAGAAVTSLDQSNEYGGPYKYHLVDTFHEGETLGPAVSYEQKDQKPYKNFVIIHGVFQDSVRSELAFKLFGRSISAERTFTALLTVLVFVLYFGLLLVLFKKDLVKSGLATILLGLLLLPVASQTLPGASGSLAWALQLPFRDIPSILFLILALLSFQKPLTTKRLSLYSAAIGFITIANFANSLDRASYIFVLGIIWLIMLFFVHSRRVFLRTVLAWTAVGAVLGLIVLGVAIKGAFGSFAHYLFGISIYQSYLDGFIFGQPSTAATVMMISIVALLFAAGAWYIKNLHATVQVTLKRAGVRGLKPIIGKLVAEHYTVMLLFIAGVIFLRSALGRAVPDHFAYSVVWLYLLLAYIGINYLFKKLPRHRDLFTLLTVILLFFSITFYGASVKHMGPRVNIFPLSIKDSQLVRPDYLQTADYLKAHLHGQDSFMTLTSEGVWYYLVNKPSPVKYPIVWYATTRTQRQELAYELSTDTHIKYLITNNNWTSDIDYVSGPKRMPEVYQVVDTKYVPYIGFGQQTIWIRK